jgi:hypothetical protein
MREVRPGIDEHRVLEMKGYIPVISYSSFPQIGSSRFYPVKNGVFVTQSRIRIAKGERLGFPVVHDKMAPSWKIRLLHELVERTSGRP